jgi:hypothetical protein
MEGCRRRRPEPTAIAGAEHPAFLAGAQSAAVQVRRRMTRRASVALALVACTLSGCVSLQPVSGAPATVVRQLDRENATVLTTRSGEAVRLANVRVEGDSLIGVRTVASNERVAIAIGDVQSVAVAKTDVTGTVLAIGTTAAVALLVFLVHVLMSSD